MGNHRSPHVASRIRRIGSTRKRRATGVKNVDPMDGDALKTRREWRWEICDTGIGFDPSTVVRSCYGLQAVRERGRLLGGRTEIKSVPGEGTRVYVELPLSPRIGEEVNPENRSDE